MLCIGDFYLFLILTLGSALAGYHRIDEACISVPHLLLAALSAG